MCRLEQDSQFIEESTKSIKKLTLMVVEFGVTQPAPRGGTLHAGRDPTPRSLGHPP